jgi:hypothetical protein
MDTTAHADQYFGKYHDKCSHRARLAGYVLLAGLFLEVVNGIIWFHGIEGLASVISVALMLGGVSGEIFFEYRAKSADKGKSVSARPHLYRVQKPEPGFSGFSARGSAQQLRRRRTPSPTHRLPRTIRSGSLNSAGAI